jgi:hypothetical protein
MTGAEFGSRDQNLDTVACCLITRSAKNLAGYRDGALREE